MYSVCWDKRVLIRMPLFQWFPTYIPQRSLFLLPSRAPQIPHYPPSLSNTLQPLSFYQNNKWTKWIVTNFYLKTWDKKEELSFATLCLPIFFFFSYTNSFRVGNHWFIQKLNVSFSVFTLAGYRVRCQLKAMITLTQKGANQVVAMMLTRALHLTLVNIWNRSRCFTRINVMSITSVIIWWNVF